MTLIRVLRVVMVCRSAKTLLLVHYFTAAMLCLSSRTGNSFWMRTVNGMIPHAFWKTLFWNHYWVLKTVLQITQFPVLILRRRKSLNCNYYCRVPTHRPPTSFKRRLTTWWPTSSTNAQKNNNSNFFSLPERRPCSWAGNSFLVPWPVTALMQCRADHRKKHWKPFSLLHYSPWVSSGRDELRDVCVRRNRQRGQKSRTNHERKEKDYLRRRQ